MYLHSGFVGDSTFQSVILFVYLRSVHDDRIFALFEFDVAFFPDQVIRNLLDILHGGSFGLTCHSGRNEICQHESDNGYTQTQRNGGFEQGYGRNSTGPTGEHLAVLTESSVDNRRCEQSCEGKSEGNHHWECISKEYTNLPSGQATLAKRFDDGENRHHQRKSHHRQERNSQKVTPYICV